MPLSFVRLLALTLARAVPIQGVAGVAAGLCMAFGHHEDASFVDETLQPLGHHDHAAHSHADEGSANGSAHDDGNDAHCGPCAACCASASIAGTAALPLPSAPSHAAYLFSQNPPLGVQPSGLYRPPLAL